MINAGYKPGSGLNQKEDGHLFSFQIVENEGRLGLGTELPLENFVEISEEENEIRSVKESPEWYSCSDESRECLKNFLSNEWIIEKKVFIFLYKIELFILVKTLYYRRS